MRTENDTQWLIEAFFEYLQTCGRPPALSAELAGFLEQELSQEQILHYYRLLNRLIDPVTHCLDLPHSAIIRPKSLFHASAEGGISPLKPRRLKQRMIDEPPLIFATPSLALCSTFLVRSDHTLVLSGSTDAGKTWKYVIGNWDKFLALDCGGWVYTLSPGGFSTKPNTGLSLFEWTSETPAVPMASQYWPSGLAAMITLGVEVYRVEAELFEQLSAIPKHRQLQEPWLADRGIRIY